MTALSDRLTIRSGHMTVLSDGPVRRAPDAYHELVQRALNGSLMRVGLACGLAVALTSACGTQLLKTSAVSDPASAADAKPGTCLPREFSTATPSQLPAISLSCLSGAGSVQLQHIGGQPVLINLWASWCTPCREEMPRISTALAATRASGRPVPTVIGVDTKDVPTDARAFLASAHVAWPVLSDPNAELATALHVPGLPVTLGLDSKGTIVYRHIGELSTTDATTAIRVITRGAAASASAPSAGKATR